MSGLLPSQAAAIVGVSTATLAAWEAQGRIRASRTAAGWRIYHPADIAKVRMRLSQKRHR